MKRDLAFATANNVDVTGPRTKRHKGATPVPATGPGHGSGDVTMVEANEDEKSSDVHEEHTNGTEQHGLDEVRELGLKVWNNVRTAVNEECVVCCFRVPS